LDPDLDVGYLFEFVVEFITYKFFLSVF